MPGTFSDGAEQIDEIPAAGRGVAVGIHRLAQELNLGVASIGQAARFREYGMAGAAAFGTSCVRHDTVGTGVVASFDDGDVGAEEIVAPGHLRLEGFIGIEVEAHHATPTRFELGHQVRKLPVTRGAADQG